MSLSEEWRKQVKALAKRKFDTKKAFTLDFEGQLDEYEEALKAWNKIAASDPQKKQDKAQAEGKKALAAVLHTIDSYLLVLNQASRLTND